MSEGKVERALGDEILLSGLLDYQSGPALRRAGQDLIRASDGPRLVIDCSRVEKSTSVGLSLLLAYTRDAIALGRTVSIVGLPEDMHEIARVSGLLEVLSIAHETQGAA